MSDIAITLMRGSTDAAYGTLADRPTAAAALAFWTYYATDTRQTFQCLRSSSSGFVWAETTGGAANASTFVYRPGTTTTTDRIFNTFADAYNAAIAGGAPAILAIDDSLGTPVTTAGTYNLKQITLEGYLAAAGTLTIPTLNLVEGTTFQNMHNVVSLALNNKCTTTSPIRDAVAFMWLDQAASLNNDATAGVPFIAIPGASTSQINLTRSSSIVNNVGGGSPRVISVAGGTLQITAGEDCSIGANAAIGPGAVNLQYRSPSATISATQGITPTIAGDQAAGILRGNCTLTAGVSAAQSAPGLAAGSTIIVSVKTMTPGAGNATVQYSALGTDRNTGNGTFLVTALLNTGAKNANDTSNVDWMVIL